MLALVHFQVPIVGSQVLGLLLMVFRVLQTVIGLTLSASIEQVMTLASICEREQQRWKRKRYESVSDVYGQRSPVSDT